MKNYNYVLPLLAAGLLAIVPVKAADVKHSTPAAAARHDAVLAPTRGAPAYKFVDADAGPAMPSAASQVAGMHAAQTLSQVQSQSFAGGSVAAAHASPGKSGLANTQAAAERISEPASELLLLVALSALAIAVRRQSPT